MSRDPRRERITIAILALGGQGGGVLADWIVALAQQEGFVVQATSVPGVAQRTGSTVYYVELLPADAAESREPVLALMPAPGDVDIVIASELMEAGRAILRGFATDRTVLIGSTHRVYSISEKSALGDGRASSERILEAAKTRCARFIGFDMEEIASRAGSVISSVMFGALAASGALPFPRNAFEKAIRSGGKGVEASLAAFAAGFEAADAAPQAARTERTALEPTTPAGAALADRIARQLPAPAQGVAREGARRLMEYQDRRYAELYLDRLDSVLAVDSASGAWRLTTAAAKYLALWMSYEDVIRVADLKVRESRFERVREEVRAPHGAILELTEYMHPRPQEICEMLPASLGRRLRGSRRAQRLLGRLFSKGRHVRTTSLSWFFVLAFLASLRSIRPRTLRYVVEQQRIDEWLALARSAAAAGRYEAALELVECQRLIKGYGDTHERGLASYRTIVEHWPALQARVDAAASLRRLREAALADEDGRELSEALRLIAA
ncbi:indolepyruvate oxidoreductase subunit beta family protein [Sphingosinicella sp. CPCC 101087]|uniref:indolepyruvate oxidoreductase subunit beta family protein n=1 Tax=Sphingosinicella sp. CPCC 101087 TaxID=2497754 RepID=UPI001FB08BE9|nr:indolepyruvate oxidoreductase subunit beta family protein [Sphingosinicella sp. CPCC 101087]